MSYSEYSKLTVTDGSFAVLSDIPAHPEHSEWMVHALAEGAAAGERGEIPIGAVVVDEQGVIIGSAGNTREREHDPSAHAEVNAIRQAAAHRGQWRLDGCTLVVTVEPCLMCAGTILASRVSTVVFGAWEEKTGAAGSRYDVLRDGRVAPVPEVYAGVRADECAQLMVDFFKEHRL